MHHERSIALGMRVGHNTATEQLTPLTAARPIKEPNEVLGGDAVFLGARLLDGTHNATSGALSACWMKPLGWIQVANFGVLTPKVNCAIHVLRSTRAVRTSRPISQPVFIYRRKAVALKRWLLWPGRTSIGCLHHRHNANWCATLRVFATMLIPIACRYCA